MPAILTRDDILQMIDSTTATGNMSPEDAEEFIAEIIRELQLRIEALHDDMRA